jgi:hypothetical protein
MSPRLLPILLCPLLLLAPTILASGSATVADPAGDQVSQVIDRRVPGLVTCQAPDMDIVTLDASSDGAVVAAGFQAMDPLQGVSCGGRGVYSESDSASYELLVHDPAQSVEFVRVRVFMAGGGLATCTSVQFHDLGTTSCAPGGSLESVSIPLKGTVTTYLGPRTFDLEGSSVHVRLGTVTDGWIAPWVDYWVTDFAATPAFTA